ncbi:MAG: hypothetical protein QXI33_03650, partial [Candidatus Pacearchaeota archaeon]
KCIRHTDDKTDFRVCRNTGLGYKKGYCQEGYICKRASCVPEESCVKSVDGNCETPPEGYKICDNNKNADPAICKKKADCKSSGDGLINPLPDANFCSENTDSCPEPANKLCYGTITNVCCPRGAGCDSSYSIPFCTNEGKCGSDQNYQKTKCFNENGKETDEKFCCKNTETCSIKKGVKICQPKDENSCDKANGETYCQGVKGSKYEVRKRCCESGTECINKYQNKPIYPICAKI